MKKGVTILLLCLLVYNAIGYYLYYEYRQSQARLQLRANLDRSSSSLSQQAADQQVADGNWVVFPIAIRLYHQLDRGLEAIEGEFVHQGRVYEKAMRSIRNDTLYLYCVNNRAQDRVHSDLSDHVKTHLADVASSHKDKSAKTVKVSLLQEYLPVQRHGLQVPAFSVSVSSVPTGKVPLTFRSLDTDYPPPRTA